MQLKQVIQLLHFHICLKKKISQENLMQKKAKELGIPEGKLWNKLQNGEEIINNKEIIKPVQVLGKKRPGKKNRNFRGYNANKRIRGIF